MPTDPTSTLIIDPTLGAARLPEIFVVVEGTLTVPTDDTADANVAFAGFRYLLAREFRRQQPALALLYELDVALLAVRRGSITFEWKLLVKLKSKAQSVVRQLGSAALLSAALALPGAVNDSIELWHKLMPPVQTQLQADMPHAPPVVVIIEVRPPDGRDIFGRSGGSHEI